MEDDEPRPKVQQVFPANLETMSVDNLKDYVAALKTEQVRVEDEIAKRSDVRSAAEAFFKKPGA